MNLEVSEWCFFQNMKFTEISGLTRYFCGDQMVCFIHRATPLDISNEKFVLEIYANNKNGVLDFYSDSQFYFNNIFKCVLKADSYLNEIGFDLKNPFIYNLDLEEKI